MSSIYILLTSVFLLTTHFLYVPRYLLQIPESHMLKYIQQVLGVILALLEDPNEYVQLTAVQCLLTVSSYFSVIPYFININRIIEKPALVSGS